MEITKESILLKLRLAIDDFEHMYRYGLAGDSNHQIRNFSEGIAFWYYTPVGIQEISPMEKYELPTRPSGNWTFLAITVDGKIIHEESEKVVNTLEDPKMWTVILKKEPPRGARRNGFWKNYIWGGLHEKD